LLRFGFLHRAPRQVLSHENSIIDSFQKRFELVFTEEFDRFSFWLDNQFGPSNEAESVVVEVT
jgi:hypothetical protein